MFNDHGIFVGFENAWDSIELLVQCAFPFIVVRHVDVLVQEGLELVDTLLRWLSIEAHRDSVLVL